MSFDDPAHCDEPMKLARLVLPQFEALSESLVFRCERCGHVETIASQLALEPANGAHRAIRP